MTTFLLLFLVTWTQTYNSHIIMQVKSTQMTKDNINHNIPNLFTVIRDQKKAC